MPAIEVELVVFSVENDALKIALEPDDQRPGYFRLPWKDWNSGDFVGCVRQLADEIAPARRMEPAFFGYFTMPHPRRGLTMSFYLCVDPGSVLDRGPGVNLAGYAQPENTSHVYLTVLAQALKRLRSDQNDRPLVPLLLPNEFTLLQLQFAQELVVGKEVDKRHFRRDVLESSWLEETGGFSGGAHRPAKLYRVKDTVVATRRAA